MINIYSFQGSFEPIFLTKFSHNLLDTTTISYWRVLAPPLSWCAAPEHMLIVACPPVNADRVQATVMSCLHDN